MIKKLVLAGCLLFCASVVMARDLRLTSAEPIQSVTVTNSTFTWTRIPGASQWVDKQRVGIWIDLEQSNTDYMIMVLHNNASNGPGYVAPPAAGGDTSKGMKVKESDSPWTFLIPHNMYIWMSGKGDGSETVHYQQLRGK